VTGFPGRESDEGFSQALSVNRRSPEKRMSHQKGAKSVLSFFAWWKTDPDELAKQVDQYSTLKVWQSARGVSALLCVFSFVVTVLLGRWVLNLSNGTLAAEVIIWGLVAVFMYRGHRWAFVLGMILWTLEKGSILLGNPRSATPVVQVIWWLIYMKWFTLGYRVEKLRQSKPSAVAEPA